MQLAKAHRGVALAALFSIESTKYNEIVESLKSLYATGSPDGEERYKSEFTYTRAGPIPQISIEVNRNRNKN